MPNTFNHANDTYMPGDLADSRDLSATYSPYQELTLNEPTVPEPAMAIPNDVNYYVNDAYMPNDLANVSLMDFGYPEDQELNLNVAGPAEPRPAETELPRVEPIARYFF